MENQQVEIDLPTLPTDYPDYSSLDYWHSRYNKLFLQQSQANKPFSGHEDWYLQPSQVHQYLNFIPAFRGENNEIEILVVGCGTSALSEYIYSNLGYEYITNLDICENVIDYMNGYIESRQGGDGQQNHSQGPKIFENMEYLAMDICNIEENQQIEEDSYDVVIDKACLDCIVCDEDQTKAQKAVHNIWRVLVSGGTYFFLSRGTPDMRMHLFEDKNNRAPEASEVHSNDEEPYYQQNIDS